MSFISSSTIKHLRIPFSFFLMPVFCIAASQVSSFAWSDYAVLWLVLHVFLYPASNGYNSYYDKDEGSIGGLEKPPPISPDLLYVSLFFDALAILIGVLYFNLTIGILLLIYGLVSKAYSHPAIRLKKYPFASLLVVAIFQGGFTYILCYGALSGYDAQDFGVANVFLMYPALLSTLLLCGSYPMTQIYQHEEDARRGDRTLSLLLGKRGTFIWAMVFFTVAIASFGLYFYYYRELQDFWILQIGLLPVLLYFAYWMSKVWKDPAKADFKHTMRLNMLSAICMIITFTYLTLK
ncbi:MAG: UbiA prenyltransferase family protein [Bernardetiaceae bacterium]|nr:UbiA prenyltransferase family protein [Bernardetiaceae bacterium]